MKTKTVDISIEPVVGEENHETEFIPVVRSGGYASIGIRTSMEDVFLCVDNFLFDYGLKNFTEGPSAFYGVCLL